MGPNRAVGTPAEHLIAHQRQPGSNGGVHRGPDLVPRRDLVRKIIERALWGTQIRPKIDPVTGLPGEKGRRVPTVGAMVADRVRAFQLIAEQAAKGKNLNLSTFLRMEALIHEVMQPSKDEPPTIAPRRVILQGGPSGLDQVKPAAARPGPEPPTVVDRDGNKYGQP
jgi:hypothetical protein